MTRIIGITGGIGSGKSTLALRFSAHNIPVIDADEISRFALTPASECFSDVVALFGTEALKQDGTPDRAYIASKIFSDVKTREALNAIVHPFVIREMIRRTEACEAPIAVWDVPLLFESGVDAFCACTVAVLCDEKIRVARTAQRDGSDEESVRARIRAQIPDETREKLATYTIRNEGTIADFRKEADTLIEQIREELQ
ncbi:MAG: dephospho-CoA kinase [Clostridia bacterium]|nr:dephospho-CoA kinase [Clostridia bacterium]